MDSTQADYRATFMTDCGQRVLCHLMAEAGVFDVDLKTTEELAVENYAKKILQNIGIYGDADKTKYIVQNLMNVPQE